MTDWHIRQNPGKYGNIGLLVGKAVRYRGGKIRTVKVPCGDAVDARILQVAGLSLAIPN